MPEPKNYCFYHELPSHIVLSVCVCASVRVCVIILCFVFISTILVIMLQSAMGRFDDERPYCHNYKWERAFCTATHLIYIILLV